MDLPIDYEPLPAAAIRTVGTRETDGVAETILVYPSRFGGQRVAALIQPAEPRAPSPVILYVHWYEPAAHDSNRTQFEAEARLLAQHGVISLLVETMWSDRDWFLKRTQADDLDNSIQQVIELRQAMDILLAQAGADASRVAYVGHDFGGMYGVVVGSVDPRPTCYVIMAATTRFPDWYLYLPDIEDAARDAFVERMAPLDPVARVAALAPAPLLFQFATDDFHVPVERAQAFFDAAGEPKELRWYEAGHGLNEAAMQDRVAWLAQQLGV